MGRIGDELAAHAFLLADLAGHAIEGIREGADLHGAPRSHAYGVISQRDEPRRLAHLAQRRGEALTDQDRERNAGYGRDRERRGKEARHAFLEHRLRRRERLAVIDHEMRERHAREHERADRENEPDDNSDRDRREGDLAGEPPHRSRSAR